MVVAPAASRWRRMKIEGAIVGVTKVAGRVVRDNVVLCVM